MHGYPLSAFQKKKKKKKKRVNIYVGFFLFYLRVHFPQSQTKPDNLANSFNNSHQETWLYIKMWVSQCANFFIEKKKKKKKM